MTDYHNIYGDISTWAGGPYLRLVTLLPENHQHRVSRNDFSNHFKEEKRVERKENGTMWLEDEGKELSDDEPEEEPEPSDLALEMTVHPITNCPEYEALSYTWGSSEDKKFAIECNGYRLVTQRHLGDALRALRLSDRARVLWIDAICINQSDDQEKGFQVAMMHVIYRQARRTVAWLGQEDEANFAPASKPMGMDTTMSRQNASSLVPSLRSWVSKYVDQLATEPASLWKHHAELKPRWEKRQHLIKASARRIKERGGLGAEVASPPPSPLPISPPPVPQQAESSPHAPPPPPPPSRGSLRNKSNNLLAPKAPKTILSAFKNKASSRKRDLEEQFAALKPFDDSNGSIRSSSSSSSNITSWRSALNNVLCREWWGRVWVVQEACLPPDVVFVCGDVMIELDLLFLGMFLNSVFPVSSSFRGHEMPAWSLAQIMEYRALHHDQAPSGDKIPSLLHLMDDFRSLDTTDPLDHVYSILGLLSPVDRAALKRVRFRPKYVDDATGERVAPEQCYKRTAMAVSLVSSNLDVLCVGRPPPAQQQRLGSSESDSSTLTTTTTTSSSGILPLALPSWVPDLTAKMDGKLSPLQVLERPKKFRDWSQAAHGAAACGNFSEWDPYFPRGGVIAISGYATDALEEVVSQAMPLAALQQSGVFQMLDQLMARDDMLSPDDEMARTKDEMMVEFMAALGQIPASEDIDRVACAVRCFGHMPDGLDAACSAFREYKSSLNRTKRAYNISLPSPSNRPPLQFFKGSSNSSHSHNNNNNNNNKTTSSKKRLDKKPTAAAAAVAGTVAGAVAKPPSEPPPPSTKTPSTKLSQALAGMAAQHEHSRMARFNALQGFAAGRKLAWTRKGYLALVSEEARVGDHVVLCKGSRLPLLMRAAEVAKQWRLVEACYVHGVMKGEVWDESLCGEMEIV